MSRLRVNAFTVSTDGFGAGPGQSRDHPLGRGGELLHQWLLPTRTFQREVQGRDGGTTGVDNDFAERSFENLGAWIMGRNMFGPVRGPWPDYEWKGAATVRQYLRAGLIDEMHLAMSPVLIGHGEPLFEGIDLTALGYRVKEHVCTGAAMHLVVGR